MRNLFIGFLFYLTLSFSAPLSVQAEKLSDYVICRLNKTIRTIRVKTGPAGCETIYTKGGKDQVVGSGKIQQSCVRFLRNVKSNLEKAAWTCREVERAVVTPAATGSSEEATEPKEP